MGNVLKGTGVAIVTPFTPDNSIDIAALQRITEHVIAGQANYIVVLGTTGESVVLSADEKRVAVDCVLDQVDGRIPVVIGIGGNHTKAVVEELQGWDFNRIEAVLSVSPYYNKPGQKGIYEHYQAVAQASPRPVILYNVPGRTGSNICPETTLKLAQDFPNIIGIKEASGLLTQCMRIIKEKPRDFLVISGDDALTFPLMALGADGVISVVANAFPKEYSSMVKLAGNGEMDEALKLHYQLIDIIGLLFADGSPGGVKAALEILGLCESHVRLPLTKVSEGIYKQLQEAMAEINS